MQKFKAITEVNITNTLDSTLVNCYLDKDYETVITICERDILNLCYDERAMLAFSYLKKGSVDNAIPALTVIANDDNDPYAEQAEYNLAYLHFQNGDPEALMVLKEIMSKKEHRFRKLAIELFNHPMTVKLKEEPGSLI